MDDFSCNTFIRGQTVYQSLPQSWGCPRRPLGVVCCVLALVLELEKRKPALSCGTSTLGMACALRDCLRGNAVNSSQGWGGAPQQPQQQQQPQQGGYYPPNGNYGVQGGQPGGMQGGQPGGYGMQPQGSYSVQPGQMVAYGSTCESHCWHQLLCCQTRV